jgi:glyoxylase-like metal-dependent hydrolase (beta-lactamase superfamily II)
MAGLKAVNVYALTDSDGVDLIDAGMAFVQAREQLEAALGKLGAGLGDIGNFLITHVHRDHYTLAVALRREGLADKGVIALGEGERTNLVAARQLAEGKGGPAFMGDLKSLGATELAARLSQNAARDRAGGDRPGLGPPVASEWEEPDRWIGGGADLTLKSRTLHAIATPGHTRGHLVFHDSEAEVLFAGDHVLPHITPTLGFEPDRNRMALRDYLASLRLILQTPDARLLPAHGPVTDSAHARVHELLTHHENRLAETLAAVRNGDLTGEGTAYQVATIIRWTRRRTAFADLGPIDQLLATGETAAHLEVLVLRGDLRKRTAPDGPVIYEA